MADLLSSPTPVMPHFAVPGISQYRRATRMPCRTFAVNNPPHCARHVKVLIFSTLFRRCLIPIRISLERSSDANYRLVLVNAVVARIAGGDGGGEKARAFTGCGKRPAERHCSTPGFGLRQRYAWRRQATSGDV
jgi:hypothetical protein